MMPTVLTRGKTTKDAETKAGIRRLCQTDLSVLARVILTDDRAPGENTIVEGFHGPLFNYIQTTPHQRNLYQLARDHHKTAIITCMRNLQRVLARPSTTILIASNKAENAEAMLAVLKGYAQHPTLLWAFPDVLYTDPARQAEKWTNSAIVFRQHRRSDLAGTVETIGEQGEVTSKHYEHGTFDDIVGFENSGSRESLQRTIRWVQAAQSLFFPWATLDLVGTPWDFADVWAWWLEQHVKHGMPMGVYREPCWKRRRPAGTAPGEYLVDAQGGMVPDEWELDAYGRKIPVLPERFAMRDRHKRPERYDVSVVPPEVVALRLQEAAHEFLMELARLQGPTRFAAQYELNPLDDETAVFRRSAVHIREPHAMPPPATLWCAMTVDPAISEARRADYTAIAVGGFDRENVLYLYDLRRGRWSETTLVEQVYEMFGRTPHIGRIGFEAVSFAKVYRRVFQLEGEKRGVSLPVQILERDTVKTKNMRIMGLEPLWARGDVVLSSHCPALADFLDEAERFRKHKESAHDDMLDAVADLLQLRMRPEGAPDLTAMVDPAVLERQRFEFQLVAERAANGQAAMDTASLRAAWSMQQFFSVQDEEREARVGGGDTDEFFGGG